MNVTIKTGDLLNQVVDELNSEFSNYTAKRIRQHIADRCLTEYQSTLIDREACSVASRLLT